MYIEEYINLQYNLILHIDGKCCVVYDEAT